VTLASLASVVLGSVAWTPPASAAPTSRTANCVGAGASVTASDYYPWPYLQPDQTLEGTGPYFPAQLPLASLTYDATAPSEVGPDGTVDYSATITFDPGAMASSWLAGAQQSWDGTPMMATSATLAMSGIKLRLPRPTSLPSGALTTPAGTPTASSAGHTVTAAFGSALPPIDPSTLVIDVSPITANSGASSPVQIDVDFPYAVVGAQPGDVVSLNLGLGAIAMSFSADLTYRFVPQTAPPVEHFITATGGVQCGVMQPSNPPSMAMTSVVADDGVISGTVFDESGTTPLGGMRIALYSGTQSGRLATTTAASDGTYSFTGLPSGPYRLQAYDPKSESTFDQFSVRIAEWNGNATSYAAAPDVDVALHGSAVADFTLACCGGTIRGTVRSSQGSAALPGATVTLYRPSGGVVAVRTTASDGSFRFRYIEPDDYLVKITHPSFFTEWHDDAWAAASAQTVSLSSGGTRNLGSLILTPKAAPSLSGTVTDSGTATPLPGATVRLYDSGGQLTSTVADANGAYALGNLGAGTLYYVRAEAPGHSQQWWNQAGPSFANATSIASNGTTPVTGVDFPLTP
jgi:hypothetical protein